MEIEFMTSFLKTANNMFTAIGLDLKKHLAVRVQFYKSLSQKTINAIAVPGQSDALPSVDNFLSSFIRLYRTSEDFRGSLMCGLMTAYVAKADGATNPQYSKRVLNFMLALYASGDKKAFQYVSGNLCSVSVRHVARVTSNKRSTSFIDLNEDEMVVRIKEQISKVRHHRIQAGLSERVAFTAGFDATVLSKSVQIHHSTRDGNRVVGCAYPNHYMCLPSMDGDDVSVFLLDCIHGKKGELAAEIKVCVISFQGTPPGISPYYTLVGRPQTINEQNSFGEEVVQACITATTQDSDAVLLNTTTDGVSTEVQWNLNTMLNYLDGMINHVSLPDTNHNVKNCRYQLVGGSSPASIGGHVFDPALLRIAKVSQKLWRVEDFASDAVLLKLASADTIKKLTDLSARDNLNCDVGNHAVTVLSLVFLRLRVYAVNARSLPWRERALYTWLTMIWFTSFHTSGSTMMTNKRNMLLETFGVLFLVTRDDVFQSRRNTSECNEHTFGMWRSMTSSREFNMDQLIRIVQKTNIRIDAIFESDLKTQRSRDGLSGYQATFDEYVSSVKGGRGDKFHGAIHVDKNKPAITQLWDEVQGLIEFANSRCREFLTLFGIEEGNGLSPFCCSISSPTHLKSLITQFFKPPKKDCRGCVPIVIAQLNSVNNDSEHEDDNEDGVAEDNDESNNNKAPEDGSLSTKNIADHVSFINRCPINIDDDNHDEEHIDNNFMLEAEDGNCHDGAANDRTLVDQACSTDDCANSNSSQRLAEFMKLLNCKELGQVSTDAFAFIELLELGKIASGSIGSQSKYMSRNQRWFKAKEGGHNDELSNKDNNEEGGDDATTVATGQQKFVMQNSLIKLSCERGKKTSASDEYYRVLSFFTKTYNKWYMDTEVKFAYTPNDPAKMKNIRILAQMMEKRGASYTEATLTKGGPWGPKHVFCIKNLNEIKWLQMGENDCRPVVLELYSSS